MTTMLRKAALVYAEDVREDIRGFAREMLVELDRLEVMRSSLRAACDGWEGESHSSKSVVTIASLRTVAEGGSWPRVDGARVDDAEISKQARGARDAAPELRSALREACRIALDNIHENELADDRIRELQDVADGVASEREIVDKTPARCTHQRHAQVGGTHEWCNDPHVTPGEPCALHLGHIGPHVTGFGDAGWSGADRPSEPSRVDVELVAQARTIAQHWIDQDGINVDELDKLAAIVNPEWSVERDGLSFGGVADKLRGMSDRELARLGVQRLDRWEKSARVHLTADKLRAAVERDLAVYGNAFVNTETSERLDPRHIVHHHRDARPATEAEMAAMAQALGIDRDVAIGMREIADGIRDRRLELEDLDRHVAAEIADLKRLKAEAQSVAAAEIKPVPDPLRIGNAPIAFAPSLSPSRSAPPAHRGQAMSATVTAKLLTDLERLGSRYAGLDIKIRRASPLPTGWDGPVRIELMTSKDSNYKYRLVTFGDTFEQAADRLLAKVGELDAELLGGGNKS